MLSMTTSEMFSRGNEGRGWRISVRRWASDGARMTSRREDMRLEGSPEPEEESMVTSRDIGRGWDVSDIIEYLTSPTFQEGRKWIKPIQSAPPPDKSALATACILRTGSSQKKSCLYLGRPDRSPNRGLAASWRTTQLCYLATGQSDAAQRLVEGIRAGADVRVGGLRSRESLGRGEGGEAICPRRRGQP
jgi:hypothetical protein